MLSGDSKRVRGVPSDVAKYLDVEAVEDKEAGTQEGSSTQRRPRSKKVFQTPEFVDEEDMPDKDEAPSTVPPPAGKSVNVKQVEKEKKAQEKEKAEAAKKEEEKKAPAIDDTLPIDTTCMYHTAKVPLDSEYCSSLFFIFFLQTFPIVSRAGRHSGPLWRPAHFLSNIMLSSLLRSVP